MRSPVFSSGYFGSRVFWPCPVGKKTGHLLSWVLHMMDGGHLVFELAVPGWVGYVGGPLLFVCY